MAKPASEAITLDVTITILTFNGADYLRAILDAVDQQDFNGTFDVLVIDSGSTDGTLDIIADFPDTRLHQIPQEEFGHGRTRDLAAHLSRGNFTAYLTHDAVPASTRWLHHLVEPMRQNNTVVAVMGKQRPRPRCFPLLKYEILGVFGNAGVDFGYTISSADTAPEGALREAAAFYSDANSAAQTAVLRDHVPYRDVPYAEDQLFGRDVLAAGYAKAYSPHALVEHSNDLTLCEYGQRIFDEFYGLRELGLPVPTPTRWGAIARALRSALADERRIARDPAFSWKRRLYWWAVNPAFHAVKWRAIRRAACAPLHDTEVRAKHSLEASRSFRTTQ